MKVTKNTTNFTSLGRNKTKIIFVDESGDPGIRSPVHIKKHQFFIMGFCYCVKPKKLTKNLIHLLLRLHKENIYSPRLTEIKFYPTQSLKKLGHSDKEIKLNWEPHYDTVRKQVANVILDNCEGVFAGILHKSPHMYKKWTSLKLGNSLFRQSLVDHILPNIHCSDSLSIVYDRGRLNPYRTKVFNQEMLNVDSHVSSNHKKNYSANISSFHDVDSKKSPGIWASDLVAGAFYHALTNKNSTYRDLLKPKFIRNGSIHLRP